MRYPTAEEVAQINVDVLGGDFLRDPGLLASAVGRPQAGFGGTEAYETLWLKTAALFESIVLNHAFLDGNKRTAVVAAIHMLNWNGYDLAAEQCEVVDLALDVVEATLNLQATSVPKPSPGQASSVSRSVMRAGEFSRQAGLVDLSRSRDSTLRPPPAEPLCTDLR
jgi:death-on-curing protein